MSAKGTRDSGVPWIGEIPESWDVVPFRYLFRESSEVNGDAPVGQMLSVSGYRGVELKVYRDEGQQRSDDELEKYRVVRPGQLAVNTMWLNYAGLGVSEHLGHVSPAYRAYFIDPRVEKRYAHHLLRSSVYVNAYTGALTGIRPNSLQMPRQTLQSWPVLVPPLEEQRRIAEFLDRETAQIDALIAKQEQLISTLAERQVSAARETIAKSGAPLVPLRRVARIVNGGTPGPASANWDGEIKWATPADMSAVNGKALTSVRRTITAAGLAEGSALAPGGSLLVSTRAPVGYVTLITEPIAFNQGCKAVLLGLNMNAKFLMHWTLISRDELERLSGGTTFLELSATGLAQWRVPQPTLNVQASIAESLDQVIAAHDGLMAAAQSSVDLLKERRQALISAAVTGQIDVGGAS